MFYKKIFATTLLATAIQLAGSNTASAAQPTTEAQPGAVSQSTSQSQPLSEEVSKTRIVNTDAQSGKDDPLAGYRHSKSKKTSVCNVIDGTKSNPSYMGAEFNFSTWGRWRLGLFGPTADIYPTNFSTPNLVSPKRPGTSLINYSSGNWQTRVKAPQNSNGPDATRSGLSNSDRIDNQIPNLENEKEIPDTRETGSKGTMSNTIDDVFKSF